jgi:hypothetical protein
VTLKWKKKKEHKLYRKISSKLNKPSWIIVYGRSGKSRAVKGAQSALEDACRRLAIFGKPVILALDQSIS